MGKFKAIIGCFLTITLGIFFYQPLSNLLNSGNWLSLTYGAATAAFLPILLTLFVVVNACILIYLGAMHE